MRKTVAKIICLLLLIPILGVGVPFGSAYVYGKIRYAEKRSTVASILDAHENELLEIINDNAAGTDKPDLRNLLLCHVKTGSEEISIPEQLGFEKLTQLENNFFFQLPYAGTPGSWVPCGLLFSHDLSTVEPWQKTSLIREDWYFYWEP